MSDKHMIAREIRATHLRAVDAFNRGDGKEFAAGFTQDCWQSMPGQAPRIGCHLILADMEANAIVSNVEKGLAGDIFFTIDPEELRVLTQTDAIERGRYTITNEPIVSDQIVEETIVEAGYYLVVWRRRADGKWLVDWDMVQSKT